MQLASCLAPGKLLFPPPLEPFFAFHPLGMSARTSRSFLAWALAWALACTLPGALLAPAGTDWDPNRSAETSAALVTRWTRRRRRPKPGPLGSTRRCTIRPPDTSTGDLPPDRAQCYEIRQPV